MTASISPRLSRMLAVSLLAAALWGFYASAIAPVIGAFQEYRTSIEQSNALLKRYRLASRDLSRLETELAGLRQAGSFGAGFLPATSETLAGADLQSQMKTSIEAGGGAVQSMQALPVKEDGKARQVTVRVQMSGQLEALQQVIYAVETADPYLFVDSMDIQGRRERPQKGQSREVVTLDIRFDVSGYMRDAPR
jgi:general secretion pathway protein M